MVSIGLQDHYSAVLGDLRARRTKLESQLKELDTAIAAIQRQVPDAWQIPLAASTEDEVDRPVGSRYGGISVRWAVLWHLSESAQPLKTGEIANALREGGYRTDSSNFPNMVSAVLSTMKTKDEVEIFNDGYRLTDTGRQTWALIKQGTKFRLSTSSNGL